MSSFICSYHVRFSLQTQVNTVSEDHWLFLFIHVFMPSNCTVQANRGLCAEHVTNSLGEQHLCKVEA